jgi:lysophospholipase L1-like esterase
MPEPPHRSEHRQTSTDEADPDKTDKTDKTDAQAGKNQTREIQTQEIQPEELEWRSPGKAPFALSGFPWYATDGVFRRLPLDPVEPLPPSVHTLAGNTAGGQLRFQTNSRRLSVDVQLSGPANMYHMPATGQCGFDLYIGPPGEEKYHRTTHFNHTVEDYEAQLLAQEQPELLNLTINFPLYKGVRELAVGLDPGADVLPPPPRALKDPVVAYGTSITQGGCASRPGMAYTNILSRRLNIDFVNLGFSGAGKGEPEVARVIASIPSCSLFIIDYEANSSLESMRETLPEFIGILRAAHAQTPILVLSRIRTASEARNEGARIARAERMAFQRDTVERLRTAGDAKIFFFNGSDMMGEDFDECTVDGSHPTDLGFVRMARSLEPVVRRILLP